MFVARFFLGLGIGPKSATVPIYAAETTPPAIRGALVMQWQMWTAFGIMLGYVADLAFYHVPDTATVTGLNWRLMMASAMFPAVIVCCFVYKCPESPLLSVDTNHISWFKLTIYRGTCRKATTIEHSKPCFGSDITKFKPQEISFIWQNYS